VVVVVVGECAACKWVGPISAVGVSRHASVTCWAVGATGDSSALATDARLTVGEIWKKVACPRTSETRCLFCSRGGDGF